MFQPKSQLANAGPHDAAPRPSKYACGNVVFHGELTQDSKARPGEQWYCIRHTYSKVVFLDTCKMDHTPCDPARGRWSPRVHVRMYVCTLRSQFN